MSTSARDLLKAAGWSEGRAIDIEGARDLLAAAGYQVSERLASVLKEYSNLTIGFVRNQREDTIWFDPRRAVALTIPSAVRSYETQLGTALVPIGFAHHDHLLILAGADGRFVGVYDDFVAELGSTPEEVVATVITGKVRPKQRRPRRSS